MRGAAWLRCKWPTGHGAARGMLLAPVNGTMPNIKIARPVSKDEVRAVIQSHCPDLRLARLGPAITAGTSPWVAAWITVNKKSVSVAPSVANMKMFLLFALIALTGVGIILYAVLAVPGQMETTRRVTAALKANLAAVKG
jgi:hypothetical protein